MPVLMNDTVKAHMGLIGANLIFGLTYVVAKHVIPDFLSPFALVFARIFGACLLFWLTSLFFVNEPLERKDIPRIFLGAIFGVAVNQSLFLNGLNFTSPIDSAIIMTTIPVLVLVIARLLLREPVTAFKVIGIVLGATGAILLITYGGKVNLGANHRLGNSITVGGAASYALYLVVIKPLLVKYHPLTVMKWIFLFGLLIVSGPGIPAALKVDWTNLPPDILFSVIFVVVGNTYIAYLLNNFSLKYVKPLTVSIYIYSQPVIASIAALIIGQDVITWLKILSALLVFAGVYFVSSSGNRTGIPRG